ncbi:S1 family peptidase [Amycolatopsis decaplanina]|uniref:Peptidase S1 and S6 chymotrypsin/Hap n=1 Tax=Amycolatopsis decaplanina DSM 44594 TaxID=1284240 RepID=M2ZTK3_9PSEU|nr:serine protease [Amycolatopsis decaplanina]EME63674.1 peptidase S1 and S6 chymotrypsin/Hap [Amycolatopsis decaplanina DSM 44594]
MFLRSRSFALLIGLALTMTMTVAVPASAIIGGTGSTRPYSFMVSLQYDSPRPDGHRCGAVLIAPQWAVTAGHCANTPTGSTAGVPRGWKVRVGSLDTTTGGEVADVDKFYRRHNSYDPPGEDIAVLHLRNPVRARPVRLAEATPADGTPVRILGWGAASTGCDDFEDPKCFPRKLREADTEVVPLDRCWDDDGHILPLCVGRVDPPVGPGTTDSGGPALIRSGDDWALAGTVIGPGIRGADFPDMYTDVSKNSAWITGIVTGTDVPPDSPVPNVEGTAAVGDCKGAVVRADTARPEDLALALTNGHCVPGERPAPGRALIDRPAGLPRPVTIADRDGYPRTTARATRLVYATITGTDIALYRLNKTYAQLAREGAKVFRLTTTPMRDGDRLLMAYSSSRPRCTVEAVVPHLREGGYQQDDAVRYATSETCASRPGYSGSVLLTPDANTVMGINNTHNRDGERCTEGNPCEVGRDGTETALKGRSYGQQVHRISACLGKKSRLELSRPGCVLPPAAF